MAVTLKALEDAIRQHQRATRHYETMKDEPGMARTDARMGMLQVGDHVAKLAYAWLVENGIYDEGPRPMGELLAEEEAKAETNIPHVKVQFGGHGYYVNLNKDRVHLAGDYMDVTDHIAADRLAKIIAKAKAKAGLTNGNT
jgi:hypothetical protein